MLTPTGLGIRVDMAGDGHFGTHRSKTKDGETVHYKHQGCDYLCFPGQWVVSPMDGIFYREAKPYPDEFYSGILIQSRKMQRSLKMFYVKLLTSLVPGQFIAEGQIVGRAQDITKRYVTNRKIMPHIHVEIYSSGEDRNIDPEIHIDANPITH